MFLGRRKVHVPHVHEPIGFYHDVTVPCSQLGMIGEGAGVARTPPMREGSPTLNIES